MHPLSEILHNETRSIKGEPFPLSCRLSIPKQFYFKLHTTIHQPTAYPHIKARHMIHYKEQQQYNMAVTNTKNFTIFVPILASNGYHWYCTRGGCQNQKVVTGTYVAP
jgi:hypothetical protein